MKLRSMVFGVITLIISLMFLPQNLNAEQEKHNLEIEGNSLYSIIDDYWVKYEDYGDYEGKILIYKEVNNEKVLLEPGEIDNNKSIISNLENGTYYMAVVANEGYNFESMKLNGAVQFLGNPVDYTSDVKAYSFEISSDMPENISLEPYFQYGEAPEALDVGEVRLSSVNALDLDNQTGRIFDEFGNEQAQIKIIKRGAIVPETIEYDYTKGYFFTYEPGNTYDVEITLENNYEIRDIELDSLGIDGSNGHSTGPCVIDDYLISSDPDTYKYSLEYLEEDTAYKFTAVIGTKMQNNSINLERIAGVSNGLGNIIDGNDNIVGTVELRKNDEKYTINNGDFRDGEINLNNLNEGNYQLIYTLDENYGLSEIEGIEKGIQIHEGCQSVYLDTDFDIDESLDGDKRVYTYDFILSSADKRLYSVTPFFNLKNKTLTISDNYGEYKVNVANDKKSALIKSNKNKDLATIKFMYDKQTLDINSIFNNYHDTTENYITLNPEATKDYKLNIKPVSGYDVSGIYIEYYDNFHFSDFLDKVHATTENDGSYTFTLEELNSTGKNNVEIYIKFAKIKNSINIKNINRSSSNLGIIQNYNGSDLIGQGSVKLERLSDNSIIKIKEEDIISGEFQVNNLIPGDYKITLKPKNGYESSKLEFYRNENEKISITKDSSLDGLEYSNTTKELSYEFNLDQDDIIQTEAFFEEIEGDYAISVGGEEVFNSNMENYNGNGYQIEKIKDTEETNKYNNVSYNFKINPGATIDNISTTGKGRINIIVNGTSAIRTATEGDFTGYSISSDSPDGKAQVKIKKDANASNAVLNLNGGVKVTGDEEYNNSILVEPDVNLNIGTSAVNSNKGLTANIIYINGALVNVFTNSPSIKDTNDVEVKKAGEVNLSSNINYQALSNIYQISVTEKSKFNVLKTADLATGSSEESPFGYEFEMYSLIYPENDVPGMPINEYFPVQMDSEEVRDNGTSEEGKYIFENELEDNGFTLESTGEIGYELNLKKAYENGEVNLINIYGYRIGTNDEYKYIIEGKSEIEINLLPYYGYQVKENTFNINNTSPYFESNDNSVGYYLLNMPEYDSTLDVEFEQITDSAPETTIIPTINTPNLVNSLSATINNKESISGEARVDYEEISESSINPEELIYWRELEREVETRVSPSKVEGYFNLLVNEKIRKANTNEYWGDRFVFETNRYIKNNKITFKLNLKDKLNNKETYKIFGYYCDFLTCKLKEIDTMYDGSTNSLIFKANKFNLFVLATTEIVYPAKPTIKLNTVSYNSIKTTWNRVSNADGYYVYRSTGGAYSYIGKTTSNYYTNGGLNTDRNYYYKIRAYRIVNGKVVLGSYSNYVKAKPYLKKTTIKLSKSGSNKIKVKWTGVSGAYKYQIYRKQAGKKWKRVRTLSSTKRSYKNKVTRGKKYYYKVRTYRWVSGKKVYSAYSSTKSKRR